MKKKILSKFSLLMILLFVFQLVFPIANAFAEINTSILPPSNLAVQQVTPDDVRLSWSSVYGATGYNVYEIQEGQIHFLGKSSSTTYNLNNLMEGSYQYVVSTLSTDGESGPSAPVSVDIIFPDMVAPAKLTGTIRNGNDVALSWDASQYAENYYLYQITAEGEKTLLTSVTSRYYTISIAPEGQFTYSVSAVHSLYGESPLSTPEQVDVTYPSMTAPENFTFTVTNGTDVTLKWNSVPYATNYNIYQIIDGQKVLKNTTTNTSIKYTNVPAGDYVYEVHSNSDRFGESLEGTQLNVTVGTVTMTAPENFTYTLKNTNDIVLSWTSVPYANSYKIYQLIDGEQVLKSTVTSTAVTFSKMPAEKYTYVVYSYSDRYGESEQGSQVTLTVETVAMTPPSNLTYSIKNGNDIALTWETVTDATNYTVYQIIDGQKQLKSTVSGTAVTYTNMSEGTYQFEVHSYSTRFGESQEGSQLSLSLTYPSMQSPVNLIQTVKNATDFTLSWDPALYATNYKVYQIVDGQKVLKSTVSGTNVTYTKMSPGEYTYVVHSYSSIFGESLEGTQLTFTLNGQTMEPPTNLTYSIANGNDITLRWIAADYATSYKIYQITEGEKILKSTVTGTTVTYPNLPEGDYHFVVHSVSSLLGESPDGAETVISLALPIMAAPQNLTYRIQNGNDVVLAWEAVQYANSYNVYELIDGQKELQKSVTSSSALLSKASAGSHTYIVHSASSRFGESIEGSEILVIVDEHTMEAPANLTYSFNNGNDIVLKWEAVTYATAYNVYQIIDNQPILARTVTGKIVTFTNMPEGEYEYMVRSYSDRFGESPEASEVSFTLIFPTMQAPENLTSSIVNGNDIRLKWDAADYATSYNIYQIIDGQKEWKKTVTGVSFTFTNMPEGEYEYEVESGSTRFGVSTETSSTNISLIWPVVQPPQVIGTIFNVNNITLTWNSVTWANEYRVYQITGNNRQLIYKGTARTYKIYNLTEDTHSFEVTAYSTRFGESVPSNRLTETIIYPEMESPAANITLLSTTSARISWNFITYANGYNVYEIIDGKPVLLIQNLNNLSYTVSNLSYANHEYYVTSYSNSFGESEPSNIALAKLIVDTEAPVTKADAPVVWKKADLVVNLTASDNESGVANTYYSVNGSDFKAGTSITITSEGIHNISFYSVDKVGNIEEVKNIEVKVDHTAPVTVSTTPEEWSKEDVILKLSASDALSGVAQTFYSLDGEEYVEGNTLTIQDEGIHDIRFYSIDVAGNVEEVKTEVVKIDKTAPEVTMDLNEEYKLGTSLPLQYSAKDNLSGVIIEKMIVQAPDETTGNELMNDTVLTIDKPGVYKVTVIATNEAGLTTTIEKQFVVYIPALIEVAPQIIKGNKGIFTVRVTLSEDYKAYAFDLNSSTLNGVNALTSIKGYYNQAKLGQFKFERSDFNWDNTEVFLEFRSYVNGYLVVGYTTVKVQK